MEDIKKEIPVSEITETQKSYVDNVTIPLEKYEQLIRDAYAHAVKANTETKANVEIIENNEKYIKEENKSEDIF